MYPQSMFKSKNKKNIKHFHLKIIIFRAVKYCSLLHRRIFVMVVQLPLPSSSGVEKRHDGECRPCIVTLNIAPVCGLDGKTYDNLSVMKCA